MEGRGEIKSKKNDIKNRIQEKVKLVLEQVFQDKLIFQLSKYKMVIRKEYLESA